MGDEELDEERKEKRIEHRSSGDMFIDKDTRRKATGGTAGKDEEEECPARPC